MNIKYIWKQHKTIAVLLCGYFVLFIGLNVKQGIVATPILQYGMFSGKKMLADTANAYVFYINNKKIALSNYSFIERDILITSLEKYLNQTENNDAVYSSFSTIVQKLNIDVSKHKEKFFNNTNDSVFKKWYNQKLESITNLDIKTAEVYQQKYTWQNNKIQLTDTAKKIFTIAY
jgi:ribosome-associated translation inhibitor RaiA